MKKCLPLAALCAIALLGACKKDNHPPAFSPTGYWTGSSYILKSSILNRDNGTSRIYLQSGVADTAAALALNGRYTIEGDVFRGEYYNETDTIVFESTSTTQRVMSGITFISLQGTYGAFPSEFIRKQ